jgi:metal-responsive CopG/Arc/MetJ family transcriptional regulator
MSTSNASVRKITISLPAELVEFADRQAAQTNTSRSQIISVALAHVKLLEEERLAAEGYRFYGQEAAEFAEATAQAAAEVIHAS